MKPTPGPWMHSRVNGVSAAISITAAAGALLADVYQEKNAALIAAAPDIRHALDVARAAIKMLNDLATPKQELRGTLAIIDAAIAKAEGKQ